MHDSPSEISYNNSRSISRHNIDIIIPGQRLNSNPKKRRYSNSKISSTLAERKQSFQPTISGLSRPSAHTSTQKHSSIHDAGDKIQGIMEKYRAKDYLGCIESGLEVLRSSPFNVDALYMVGLSSSMVDRHDLTIKHFETLLKYKPQYKKNIYLLLSIAYKKTGDVDRMLNTLNRSISMYDKFFEAFVYRAKLHTKMGRLAEAYEDYMTALSIDDSKYSTYTGLGDVCRHRQAYDEAVKYYSRVIDKEEGLMEVVGIKRVQCYVQMSRFEDAMKDINRVGVAHGRFYPRTKTMRRLCTTKQWCTGAQRPTTRASSFTNT